MKTATPALILRELSFGASTTRDLADALGLTRRGISYAIGTLRKQKRVRIAEWELWATPVWGLGKIDKPKPVPLSGYQRTRRYRERRRAEARA